MRTIVTRKSIMIASTAMILALISIISVYAFRTPGPVTGFANVVTAPVRVVAATVAQTFESIFAAIYRYDELERRYDALAARYAQLVQAQHEAGELAEENATLRELLGLRERHAGWELVQATFVNWGSDNWSHSFIINRGYANSDVRSGMSVATGYGFLIGQITDVRATTSKVITIFDTTFAAAAFVGDADMDGDYRISATATGDFNFMRNGLLILDYIDDGINLLSGTTVITSGHGAVFPPGLIIGEIESVYPHANGIGRFATIRPMRELDNISTVFVITDFEDLD